MYIIATEKCVSFKSLNEQECKDAVAELKNNKHLYPWMNSLESREIRYYGTVSWSYTNPGCIIWNSYELLYNTASSGTNSRTDTTTLA